MLYFSYGSNMSTRRLRQRSVSGRFIAVASLQKHLLKFHKVGRKDGSGKCDIFQTGDSRDKTIGVVFDLKPADKAVLDQIEGLHCGYEEKSVELLTAGGDSLVAFTYYATNIDPSLKPYHWYKEHVLRGAAENSLPGYYIRGIERVVSVADPQPGRHEKEMAIYL